MTTEISTHSVMPDPPGSPIPVRARSPVRCGWVPDDPLYQAYHDEEWGVPVHDERAWLELLVLGGMQAGLSWFVVLNKRARFRKAFHRFDPRRVARFTPATIARLLEDAGLIRNRQKMAAAVRNARAFLGVQQAFGTFDAYIWRFVGGRPLQPARTRLRQLPVRTKLSDIISQDLIDRGFCFVGSTICYAVMQASGMVNDHLVTCFRYAPLSAGDPWRAPSRCISARR